jgi:hypothetical protein
MAAVLDGLLSRGRVMIASTMGVSWRTAEALERRGLARIVENKCFVELTSLGQAMAEVRAHRRRQAEVNAALLRLRGGRRQIADHNGIPPALAEHLARKRLARIAGTMIALTAKGLEAAKALEAAQAAGPTGAHLATRRNPVTPTPPAEGAPC